MKKVRRHEAGKNPSNSKPAFIFTPAAAAPPPPARPTCRVLLHRGSQENDPRNRIFATRTFFFLRRVEIDT